MKRDRTDEEVAQLNTAPVSVETANRQEICTSTASTSSAATSNLSHADEIEMRRKVPQGDVSFDTFTEFQQNQPDQWSSFSPPVPRVAAAGLPPAAPSIWSTFQPGYIVAHFKRDSCKASFSARGMENLDANPEDSVGLDIDEPEARELPVNYRSRSNSGGWTDSSSITASPSSTNGRYSILQRECAPAYKTPIVPPTAFFPPPPTQSPRSTAPPTLLRCPSEGIFDGESQSAYVEPTAFFPPPRAQLHGGSSPRAGAGLGAQQTPPPAPNLGPYYETYFSGGVAATVVAGTAVGGVAGGVLREKERQQCSNEAEEWRAVLQFFVGPLVPANTPIAAAAVGSVANPVGLPVSTGALAGLFGTAEVPAGTSGGRW